MTDKITGQAIIKALAKALPELEGAKKDKVNPHFKNKYATLGSVIEAIQPITAHGLWYRQESHEKPNGVCIETIYIHESGEELSAGMLFIPADKNNAQGFGSAMTYCRRYSLQSAFGLDAEDDDGNAASTPKKVEMISDADRDEIQARASAAGLTLQKICASYQISSLKDLPASKVSEVKRRIQQIMEDKKEQA